MFVIFSQVGVPATIAATEPFAWAVALATSATGVEYPTGKFHRKCPKPVESVATRMAVTIRMTRLGFDSRRLVAEVRDALAVA